MQEASDNLVQAVTGDSVVWDPTLQADWALDGYGDDDSIDDLTGQMLTATVQQSMDDGMPSDVAFSSDGGVPAMSASLAGRHVSSLGRDLDPAQYFSPFRSDSPLFGFDRDLAPVALEQGAITEGGPERVRLFTGQMADVPVRGGRATLQAGSATRQALSQLVHPPVVLEQEQDLIYGLTATFPITWALFQCGINASPPPQEGCILWAPMHGGGVSYVPLRNNTAPNSPPLMYHADTPPPGVADFWPASTIKPRWCRGPFAGAAHPYWSEDRLTAMVGFAFTHSDYLDENGEDWLSQAGNRGRLQFWVRGDDLDPDETPSGSGAFVEDNSGESFIAGVLFFNQNGTWLVTGIRTSDRRLFAVVDDNNGGVKTETGPILPSDGAWHFVGFAWDMDANTCWFNLDGAVTTETFSPTIVVANLPAAYSDFSSEAISLRMSLPVAELQIGTGDGADPDDNPLWANDQDWTQGAFVYPSALPLVGLVEPQPREAWEYIASFAQGEMACMNIDENDLFHYRPRGWFATVEGQTVAQTITTERDAALPDVALDPSRIRTIARVTYQQTLPDESRTRIFETFDPLIIPPGETRYRIALPVAVSRLFGGTIHLLTQDEVDGVDSIAFLTTGFIAINSEIDGTGTYHEGINGVGTVIQALIESWTTTEAVLYFNNSTGTSWYVANDSPADLHIPYLALYAHAVPQTQASITEFYEAGVTARGLRGITVNLDAIQDEQGAYLAARRLVGDLREPIPIVPSATVFGDPRRQPGDMVTFEDDVETGLSGEWRVYKVQHSINGADYTQEMKMQRARAVGTWGDGVSRWGQVLWAGQEAELA